VPPELTNRAQEVIARCRKLAGFSEDAGGTRRTFLSPPMRDCHREIAGWLGPLGAEVAIDDAGNLRALYPGTGPDAPRLLLGSHLDTVPNAGAYDGVLGVIMAIALLECVDERRFPFAIEVIGFSEEEGVRFGTPFIGSRALVGRLDEEFLGRTDQQGISVRQAILDFRLDPKKLAGAILPDDALGYIEFHLEQGPVLEKLGKPLAAVEAVVGQSRLELTFVGRANHAGTTPMDLRCDALAGAAEWINTVERTANSIAGLVATVGRIEAKPGATNVIAGETALTLDVRHRSDEVRSGAVDNLICRAQEIAQRRGLLVKTNSVLNQPAVAMDTLLTSQIEEAIRRTGCEPHRMASGAGHDAMVLAEKIPAGMIFLRTPGGISHHPAESVKVQDVACAIECGLHLLDQLAGSTEFQTRTHRAQSR
jgi:allantoate deiminase